MFQRMIETLSRHALPEDYETMGTPMGVRSMSFMDGARGSSLAADFLVRQEPDEEEEEEEEEDEDEDEDEDREGDDDDGDVGDGYSE